MRLMMCMWAEPGWGLLGGARAGAQQDASLPCPLRYDYKIAREYNWNVKNKASKGYEENYFFIFREGDGVYYNELETRYCSWLTIRGAGAICRQAIRNGQSFCEGERPGSLAGDFM